MLLLQSPSQFRTCFSHLDPNLKIQDRLPFLGQLTSLAKNAEIIKSKTYIPAIKQN